MYYYELFSHASRLPHRAHVVSSSTCVLILCTALTVLPPFLLTYYTEDFWTTESIYSEQPRLQNTTKFLFIGENTATTSTRFFGSSYSTLNRNFETSVIPMTMNSSSYDIDGDGLIDQFRYSTDLILDSTSTIVRSMNIWLIYQLQLQNKQRINMETMALVNIVPSSSLTPGSNVNLIVYGQLIFEQNRAIQSSGSDSTYDYAIIDPDTTASSSLDLNSILSNYFTRHYYTSFQTDYVWMTPQPTNANGNTVTISIVVNVGRQAIRYNPGFWQDFKWGWIQYVSVLLPFLVVFNRLKLFVFSNHLVRTLVPLSAHRHQA